MGCNASKKVVEQPIIQEIKPIVYEELDLECIICMNIKKDPYLTNCCMRIVCPDCANQIDENCPLRCVNEGPLFGTNPDLDRKVMNEFQICKRCDSKFHPWDLHNHQDNCLRDELPKEIEVPQIHEHLLIETNVKGDWKCSIRTNLSQRHHDLFSHKCFLCKQCNHKFCRNCVLDEYFYEEQSSSNNSSSEISNLTENERSSNQEENSEESSEDSSELADHNKIDVSVESSSKSEKQDNS
ncbi:unnamed protein product [Moneuplotes crassus]|uniref:RING-type domain-containing protein n=1 Tax=Euplotes crassus TaxID=5936 RepID=A0AAD2D2D8_EUPCR|nr:unnamed protein product [Moneuplotes crassus]